LAVSAIIIARLLGPDGYGAYTLALILPNVLLFLLGLGVATGLTRFAAQQLAMGDRPAAFRLTKNGIYFLLSFAIMLSAVSYFASGYVSVSILRRPGLTPLCQFACLVVLSQGIIQSVISALLGWNAVGSISIVHVSQAILKLVVATALVVLGFGVFGAMAGLVASSLVGGGYALLAIRNATKPQKALEPTSSMQRVNGLSLFLSDNSAMLRYGLPHYAGSLASGLALQYVTIVLATIAANAVVGYYQSASNVLIAVSLTSSAVSLTLLPAFAHLDGIRADTGLAFRYALKYTSLLVSPLIFLLMGAARPIIEILYGSSFASADTYLILLCASNLPILLGYSTFPSFFSGIGRTRLTMWFFLVQACVQAVLAPALALWLGWGVDGLIYSILLSNLAATLLGVFIGRSVLELRIGVRSISLILMSSIIALATILPIRALNFPVAELLLDLIVFTIVFLTVVPLTGAIDGDDVIRLGIVTGGMGLITRVFSSILGYEARLLRVRKSGGANRAGHA
jgi:O-antigen/teichoic acid export membrane protein